jgi:hypothetical protein
MTALAHGSYVLWCMRNDGDLLEADLVFDEQGVSLQLFVNDRLTADAPFPTRSHAVQCARQLRVSWEERGWTLLGSSDLPGEHDDAPN